jgi:uncharacterized protein YhaN
MNALELADMAENACCAYQKEIATMLRQQQAEIEKWTDQYQRLNENLEMWKAGHFKQQAEIEELKAKLQLHEAMDNQCASLMQQFRKASEK